MLLKLAQALDGEFQPPAPPSTKGDFGRKVRNGVIGAAVAGTALGVTSAESSLSHLKPLKKTKQLAKWNGAAGAVLGGIYGYGKTAQKIKEKNSR